MLTIKAMVKKDGLRVDRKYNVKLCFTYNRKVKRLSTSLFATDKKTSHFDAHKTHAYRPDVKACTFKVSRHDSHKKVVAKVEHMKGVMDTKWNPRTREVTVIYDAKVTSARHIKHFMA